ncbi:MAG: 4Fe-4S dicluster domain-containing protein, partial [Lysobacterales bacterium]
VIRPPGAIPEEKFTGLCARCGNCVNACPEKIIHHDLGHSGITGLLTPVIRFDSKGYCKETCNTCCTVCPTGAIRNLSLEEKFHTTIGSAIIIKKSCLSWDHNEYCMVCQEYCPYQAIKAVPNKAGVLCPVVDIATCRGCGICEQVCAAEKLAIIVQPKT